MVKEKQYFLFDLDGTIIDPKKGITQSVAYALNKFDIAVPDLDTLIPFIGPPLKEMFMKVYGFSEEDALQGITWYREYFREKGMGMNTLYPGIEQTLKTLKNNEKHLTIATSKPTEFAKKILDSFELTKYFDFIVGSNLDNTRTAKAEVIAECMRLLGDPDTSKYIMIGDKEHDIIGAKTVGISSIGVLYGYGSKKELEKAGADFIVANHTEIPNLI